MTEGPRFVSHSEKQDAAIFSDSKITLVGTGIQWGKTSCGAFWLRRKIHNHTHPEDNFIVTTPNYKTLQQSTLPPLLRALEGLGTYNKTDAVFTTHWKTNIWIRTATDPDSIVGIPRARGIWGDEAGKYPLYFWQNIQGRASPMNAPILLTTSPYSMNWVYKELIKPHRAGLRPDVKLIQAASSESPYFNQEAYKHAQATMDPRRFKMMYGGEWERMAGLVYDCFHDTENVVNPFQLPDGTKYYAGVDWGYYPDPFALKVRAITPDGRHYSVSEFCKTQLTITDIIEIAKQKKTVYGIQTFFCDPSQPGYIEEFNRNGLPAIGADNDIRRGIDLHYELIKTRKLKYFAGMNPVTLDELEGYGYPDPKDLRPDQDSKELKPVGQNDHCLDAERYVTISTYRSHLKKSPLVPGENLRTPTHTERLEQLKKRRSHSGSESWS